VKYVFLKGFLMHGILRFSKIPVLSVCFAIAAGCDSGNVNSQVEGDQPTAELAKVDPDGGTPGAPPGLNPSPAQGKQADNPLFKDFRSADPSPFVHDGRLKTLAALLVGRGSRSTLSARLASLSKESRGTIQGFSTVS